MNIRVCIVLREGDSHFRIVILDILWTPNPGFTAIDLPYWTPETIRTFQSYSVQFTAIFINKL